MAITTAGMKWCSRCTTAKTLNFFYAGQNWCKSCSRTYLREWHQADRSRAKRYHDKSAEQAKVRGREWYRVNREAKLAQHREWVSRNKVAIREYVTTNREAYAEYARIRRFRQGSTKIPIALIKAKMAYWGNRCWICNGSYEHIDHVKPLAAGGPHLLANLRPACASCNQRKNRTWPLTKLN